MPHAVSPSVALSEPTIDASRMSSPLLDRMVMYSNATMLDLINLRDEEDESAANGSAFELSRLYARAVEAVSRNLLQSCEVLAEMRALLTTPTHLAYEAEYDGTWARSLEAVKTEVEELNSLNTGEINRRTTAFVCRGLGRNATEVIVDDRAHAVAMGLVGIGMDASLQPPPSDLD